MVSKKNNKGSILVFAVFVATSLFIFSFTWFRVSRETGAIETRIEQKAIAGEIAVMIHEEASLQLKRAGTNQKSPLFWHFLRAVSGEKIEIRLPFARAHAAKLLPPGFACEFSCSARVVEFRKNDPEGRRYGAKNEGHGIVALTIDVSVTNERSRRPLPVSYQLEKHHDYIIASMICSDEYGSKLKKVLLTRKERSFYDQSLFSGENATLVASQSTMLPPGQTPENLKVYNHYSLWTRRGMKKGDLENLKIVDFENRIININGINHCHGHIDLPGNFKYQGQGVLIADSFSINGSLTRQEKNDLLVLFARNGKITVNSTEKVQAALVAINRNYSGTIESAQPLNLFGLILTDRINLNNWSQNEHRVVYDPIFLNPEETYQISFSPWLNLRSGQIK